MERLEPHRITGRLAMAALLLGGSALWAGAVKADGEVGFLETVKKNVTLSSTVADNGDQNPYAVVVTPVSAGVIQQDDVLIDHFNHLSNLQGLGTTIVDYNPATKKMKMFASIPGHLSRCPGGVGLTAAMMMLETGRMIVGSTPSEDGTTRTKGDGCLLVLDANGTRVVVWSGPDINGPWGKLAVSNNGKTATTRTNGACTGREITQGGLPQRPLSLITAPNGHLLAANGRNGHVLEIDPIAGKQIHAQWIAANQAQSPSGNADLFGLAIKPDGKSFYHVEDELNAIVEAI